MISGLLGRKIGMTQIFRKNGEVVPVTVIEAGPCVVTQIRTKERDGYESVQIGFGATEARKLTKPQQGHLAGAKTLVRHLREFRADDIADHTIGDTLDVSLFTVGQLVDVVGTSKGRGFAGVVKRHHFKGGPKTHGQSDRHRAPGSIGSGTTPGRVWKGMRMAGRMGNQRVTVQNLEIVEVLPDQNLILVHGSVPGARNGLVRVQRAIKAAK
jgi:large subunit ribosomal protein L3